MSRPSRRRLLRVAGAGLLTVGSGSALAACGGGSAGGTGQGTGQGPGTSSGRAPRRTRHRYGSHPQQFGDLYLPASGRVRGTVVVIHGGFWQSVYTLDLGAPLASDLARRGWAAWNIEYRRLGDGGGWPTTFTDVAAAVDHLAELDGVDLEHVIGLGHSAGGQLGVWAASPRSADDVGGRTRVPLTGVVSQAGVLSLATAAQTGLGGDSAASLVGGSPGQVPRRYAQVDPIKRLPLGVPVRAVHGREDTTVPLSQSAAYVARARAAGDDVSLVQVEGDHFALIDTSTSAWATVVRLLDGLRTGG